MTLESDHELPAGYQWKDEYVQCIQYIAANDPDDDYYRPTSALKADDGAAREAEAEAVAGPSRLCPAGEPRITWPELKNALKYQLRCIIFDEQSPFSLHNTTSSLYPPNLYGWQGNPEELGGLSVEEGTKAKGKGFPRKPLPTLHPAAYRLPFNKVFFPPYPRHSTLPAEEEEPAPPQPERAALQEENALSLDPATASFRLNSRFTTALHSDASELAAAANANANADTSAARSMPGDASASTPETEATDVSWRSTNASGTKDGTFQVKPADESSFFPSKAPPPGDAFGSWGKSYASEDEIKREYRLLCNMLDEFDEVAPPGPELPAQHRTGNGRGAGASTLGSAAANGTNRASASAAAWPSPPFTVQRLCELILEPHRHYTALPKYIAAVKRTLSVTAGRRDFPAAPLDTAEDEDMLNIEDDAGADADTSTLAPAVSDQGHTVTDPASVDGTAPDAGTDTVMLNGAAAAFPSASLAAASATVSPFSSFTADTPRARRASSHARSRSGTPASPSLRPHEPLWSPIPFLLRQEAEDRERERLISEDPSECGDEAAAGTKHGSAAAAGQPQGESETKADNGGGGALPASDSVESMDLDTSIADVTQEHSATALPSDADNSGRELAAPAAAHTERSKLGSAAITSAAAVQPQDPSSTVAPASALSTTLAHLLSPTSTLADPIAGSQQPLGVPDGRVDELDDALWRGKSKTGLPRLDAEMQPISVTTTGTALAGGPPARGGTGVEDAGRQVQGEGNAESESRQLKRLKSEDSVKLATAADAQAAAPSAANPEAKSGAQVKAEGHA
ncbi:hypothetical protein K437DRAFT_254518 [Tilletiaria anomala UBC 951]|uniref:PPP4R2-domain-containing protein n=1 Tax=Tilletiaria anomala (strain ATCC 24038 / CBS 436.72 / UBC 951) TaxID=1037660 RepID=A0A066WHY4_TILAU|nr:uncharacterized protein K437DRAFT_254518 [Tilletiaria anomala UBC 951]KDN52143.1 hypothetical protein K437DRAFT_254518 [Tilletiaria anomala UBC 951]